MKREEIISIVHTEVNKLKASIIPIANEQKDKYLKTKDLFKNYKTYKARIEDAIKLLERPELIKTSTGIITNESKAVNKVFLSEFEKLEDWIEDKKNKISNWETMVKMADFGFEFIKDRKNKEVIIERYKNDLDDAEICNALGFSDERTVRKYRSIILRELSEILF